MKIREAAPDRYAELVEARRSHLREALRPILEQSSRVDLEVGSGHGHYLTAYAMAHPDRLCVGIDICRDRVARAIRKRDRAGLKNLYFIQCDGADFLVEVGEQMSIVRTFVLFPDPWPKRRHHKNRLINPSFLKMLAKRGCPGATLHFRTDHLPYFQQAVSDLRDHAAWNLDPGAAWPFEEATVFQKRASCYYSATASVRPSKEVHPDHQEDLNTSR